MPTDETPTLTTFTSGDLVISVSGDGADDGTFTDNQASPITLDEITTGGTLVGQLVLPQTTTTVNGTTEYAISGEYGSSSEGSLQLSADGQSLVIAGYGVNAAAFNSGGAAAFGDSALGQSTSLTDTAFTPVPRVIADISFNGTVDTSTALFNVFNTNNPRSVATVNGTSFYISGQGVKGDTTQGVFVAQDGANGATAIDTSTDTRTVEIVNGQLFVSRDSTQGAGGTSDIASFGTVLPISATTATILPGIAGSLTLTAGQENSVNGSAAGTTVHLSPENYFFANATTLYVADGGNPKEGGLGDGGLQKWSFINSSWVLDYTLSNGLNLVADTATAGTTGLIGLTGVVETDGTVQLFATNATIGDLDPTFVFSITDTLDATMPAPDESFTTVMAAAPDTNIRGISFAPTAAAAAPVNTVVSAGSPLSGLTVTSGGSLTVLSGGVATSATILSGGSAVISAGGTDVGDTIAHGAMETVLGSAAGDQIDGTQLVSATGASVSDETVFNGGVVELFLKGETATGLTLTNGGILAISGNATATDTTISGGGIVDLESAKAVLTGSLTFVGSGTLEVSAVASAGVGDQAVISGFGAGDVVDLTTTIGAGATISTSVVSGNTVATVTNGAVTESFIFAGSAIGSSLTLTSDGSGGEEIAFNVPAPVSSTVAAGETQTGFTVSGGNTLVVASGGSIVDDTILSGGTVVVSGTDTGSIIVAGGNETILGSATADQVFGTQLVSAGTAVVSNETVFNGGVVDLFLKGGIADDLTISSGGTLNISGNATANDTVLMGGAVLDLQSPKANVAGTLTFSGAATLEETDVISAGFGVSATISGFAAGDTIDLTVFGGGAVLTTSATNGNTVETVTSGGVSESFTFAGTFTSGFFNLAPDTVGGVMITATGTPCYCPGTLILTDRGEMAVETLQIGDRLVTQSGAVRPIRWIGRRAYSGRFAAGQKQILPVVIAAGALADGLPRRDLMVSPLHAMFIDGVLIPASALVNGTSIVQLAAVESVAYFHVELESHDVILAEGAPSESFVDDDSRGMFHNAGEYGALYPDAVRKPARYCAPRVEDGAMLEAVRRRLADRATPPALAGGRLAGHIDDVTRGRIQGWARDEAAPGQPVRLRVIANDVVLCEVVADQYRPDLEAAGIGNGRHAFDVTIPGGLSPAVDHVIRVQRVSDGAALPERRCA